MYIRTNSLGIILEVCVCVCVCARAQIQKILSTHLKYLGGGNSTLLQYSCLENPMGGGAW